MRLRVRDLVSLPPRCRYSHVLRWNQTLRTGTLFFVRLMYWHSPSAGGGGGAYDKWKERSTPGIYLGFSPLHARSVALVLNPTTGYVSPQFHIVFDPTFATVSGKDGNIAPYSLWQARCGFKKDPVSRFAHTRHNEASPDVIKPWDAANGRGRCEYGGSRSSYDNRR
jgi:hypothetical protein